MSDDDQKRVLRMVAERKISAEEGAELLDALNPERIAETAAPAWSDAALSTRRSVVSTPISRRSLVIFVAEGGDCKVNVRIPLGLARAATRFIPGKAQEYLDDYEIDLKELLAGLGADLSEGPLLEVQEGEDVVRIAVE